MNAAKKHHRSARTRANRLTRRIRLIFASALSLLFAVISVSYLSSPPPVEAISTTIVISQVYGGGGNAGATYTHDFIELYNLGSTTIDLTGWSVQYASATGSTWQVTPLSGMLAPGRYYLVQEGSNAAVGSPLPTPDATGTIMMAVGSGKVALVNTTTALTGTCPTGASIIDFVGYGPASGGTPPNCFEGAGPTGTTLTSTTAAIRRNGGRQDTDNNNLDFMTGTPTPRNRALFANSSIAVDSSSRGCQFFDLLTGPVLSWSHTVGGGTNRILIVGVSTDVALAGGLTPTSVAAPRVAAVTYNGQALTRIDDTLARDATNRTQVEMFRLLEAQMPPAGTYTIDVTLTLPVNVSTYAVGGGVSFSGVDQATPFNTGQTAGIFAKNTGSSTTASVTVVSGTNELVVDTVSSVFTGSGGGRLTAQALQIERWNGLDTPACFSTSGDSIGAGSTKPGASPNTTMSWTLGASNPWAIGAVSLRPAVTRVELASFEAAKLGSGVSLGWRTGFEVDNLGFNLYRERKGKRVQVNPSMIAGSSLMIGPGGTMTAGDSYSWFDPQGTADSVYYLEDIDLKGTRTLHGPISPVASNSANIKAGQRQSMMLSEINSQSASINGASRWQRGWAASVGEGRTLLYSNKPDADRQQPLASQGAVKISVNQRGWYRVTQSDLAAAGFNTNFDPQFLRLFNGNMEVPLLVNAAQRGQFAPGDSFEFYGTALDTLSTDTNTYWLIVGKSKGLRIAARPTQSAQPKSSNSLLQQTPSQGQSGQSGTVQTSPTVAPQRQADSPQMNLGGWFIAPTIVPPLRVKTESDDETASKATAPAQSTSEPQAAATSATQKSGRRRSRVRKPRRKAASRNHAMRPGIAAQSFPYTVELNENLIYISGLRNGETENFFGQVVGGTAATQHLFLENVYQGSGGTALLEIGLQGYTLVGHQVRVKVNGQEVGSISFNNQEQGSAQFSVPSSLLLEGDNTITIERTGGDLDVSLVDTIRVTYDHGYRADGNVLYFSAQGSTRLEGFTNGNIRVMDISDPLRIRELERNVETSNGGFAATVQVSGERYCLAFTDDEVLHPAGIELDKPSNLKSDNQSADLVIISYGGFLNSVKPLAQLRSSQGLKVSVVDVQDVYDEFSYGAHSPHALKDFLSWTKSHWQKAPQFVLLVGDASLDPRNYLGGGETDFVPTKLVDVSTMETASDDWLVDFNNDGAPEMALGRLPARTQAEVTGMVAKIVSYSPANVQQQVLMVIDRSNNNDSFNFQQASTEISALLPSSLTMRTISRGNDTDDSVHNQILSAINEGPLMVNYIGHGSVEVWTGAPILSTTDMSALNNNNRLPVFLMMTCLNGYYQNSARESLAESLLRDSGGAVAVWASSGMTDPASQAAMNQQFYRLLFGTDALTLGEAAQKAKESITDGDVRRTWILFGDPTMKLQ